VQISSSLNLLQVVVDGIIVDTIILLGEVEQGIHTLLLCRITGLIM
jgi:hypothetical protein